jgi:hypothetical protein
LEAPLNNSGTITQTAGQWTIGPSGVVNNQGLYDLQTDNPGIIGGVFNNENDGIFRKSLNAGVATPLFASFNNRGGTIDVQRGTFDLQVTPGNHTGGTFFAGDGSTFIPFLGTFTGPYTGAKAGSGVVNLAESALAVGAGGGDSELSTERRAPVERNHD